MTSWAGPGSLINHVYPDDVKTKKEKAAWRSLVRRRMKQGILPPELDIQVPPQKVESVQPVNPFLAKVQTNVAFLRPAEDISEEEKEDEW